MAKTNSGYDLHELLSALQKCVRRGLEFEYEATHFAVELEEFNPTALWNRLKIIASEDVGAANSIMPILIENLHKSYLESKQKLNDDSYRLYLVNAVVCLCRSPKSRITDDLLVRVYLERQHGYKLPNIPDFALDGIHTLRWTKEGRETWDKVENEPFPNPYREKAKLLLLKYGKPS